MNDLTEAFCLMVLHDAQAEFVASASSLPLGMVMTPNPGHTVAEVATRLGDYRLTRDIDDGSIYVALRALANRNLVASRIGPPPGQPNGAGISYFVILPAGITALSEFSKNARVLVERKAV